VVRLRVHLTLGNEPKPISLGINDTCRTLPHISNWFACMSECICRVGRRVIFRVRNIELINEWHIEARIMEYVDLWRVEILCSLSYYSDHSSPYIVSCYMLR
jgi:hypothetical protein